MVESNIKNSQSGPEEVTGLNKAKGSDYESPFYINISENGLKTLTEEKILYTSKFHKI